jgi:predicted DNA-binding transcriptional regulator AlpA
MSTMLSIAEKERQMATKLIEVNGVAEMLGVGTRTVWRLRDGGQMPKPINVARCVRWRLSDLVAWIDCGCPDVRRTGWKPPAVSSSGGSGKGGTT